MSATKMVRTALALAALAAAASLCACGRQGQLERPAPLFGGPASPPRAWATDRDADAARARADGARTDGPRAPQSVGEVRDAGLSTAAISAAPHAPPNPDTPAAGAAPAPQ